MHIYTYMHTDRQADRQSDKKYVYIYIDTYIQRFRCRNRSGCWDIWGSVRALQKAPKSTDSVAKDQTITSILGHLARRSFSCSELVSFRGPDKS